MGVPGVARSSSGLIAAVAICGLMIGACGSSSSSSKAVASPTPSPSPRATTIASVDACTLVTAADASSAAGVTVSNLASAAQIPGACFYTSSDGTTNVIVIAQAYADSASADAVSPEQLAAALNGTYGITNAKTVSGIGDKAVEYTVSSQAAGSTGTVIFVFKANVVVMIAISPLTDVTKLENLARAAVGRL